MSPRPNQLPPSGLGLPDATPTSTETRQALALGKSLDARGTRPLRVLIVDDSPLARRVIANSLKGFPEIHIVGTAGDPYMARDKILELNPDVITLDIEMPRMDGITFLKLIMKHRPMPVIIMSSLTAAGSEKAFEALAAGAVDVVEKPHGAHSGPSDGGALVRTLKAAVSARLRAPVEWEPGNPAAVAKVRTGDVLKQGRSFPARSLILLGASTGGTEALKVVLSSLPADLPGICIVQHIPAFFSRTFAERLNRTCAMEVREAQDGDAIRPGLALVAPGGLHTLVRWSGAGYRVELSPGPPLHYQRPAVDILFESAVKAGAGRHAVAALLTGMGSDGSAGLLRLREAGAATIAQDEASSVVFGMPREAIRLGAALQVLPLQKIGPQLDRLCMARTT